ncbi:DUF4272 domain-containing protein [Collimonas silvisoli]|uniref:DUF4272 domain-containing protein n=1 Tax=Collimonas silvisoli TaxID=2825884 RepID=UPI001B8C0B35|nr:DUF4272 domain-containing protein [Collimonas silvisoli]
MNNIEAAAAARKTRSEAHLAHAKLPIDPTLPPLSPELSALARTPEEIAARAICLCICAARAEGLEQQVAVSLTHDLGVAQHLRPRESDFLNAQADPGIEGRLFQWGYEACWVLLWVLGRIERLDDPVAMCDPQRVAAIITTAKSIERLIGTCRSDGDILDAADLTWRFLGICRQAVPSYQNAPGGVICQVVAQRQYAFQWLLDPARQPWEDIVVDI